MTVDVLAIGAHPDDVDLGVGGTLLALAAQGYSTGILDLTLGELGSRGTVEERHVEAQQAAEVLKVSVRVNVALPDGGLANTPEQRAAIIPVIRQLRPKMILIHREADRHPDHRVAADLCLDANFFAGVSSIITNEDPHRAAHVYQYNPYFDDETPPQVVMDISPFHEQKMEALAAYRSQFHNPEYIGTKTVVSSPEFWNGITTRSAYWGHRIGVAHGEPLYGQGPLSISTFTELGTRA